MERNFIFENEKGIFDLIENKGVLIDIPNIPLSQRRFETKEIDGKNGTYTIDKKTYKDRYVTLKTTFQEKPILDIFDGTGGRLHINNEDAFYKASDLILHEFRKMTGRFVSVGLVKISFPVEEIYTTELDN